MDYDSLIIKILIPSKCISKIKKEKIITSCPNILEYINNRYPDSDSFNETINRMRYGGPEIAPKCPICGKKTIYKYKNIYTTFCSHECQYKSKDVQAKRENTCLKNNGVRIPAKNKTIRNKINQTNIKKYGATTFAGSDKWKDFINDNKDKLVQRYKDTCIKKYGVPNYQQSEEYQSKKNDILKKRENTNILKYGETSYAKTDQFKTMMEEKMPSILQKMQNTCMEKYGVKWYFQSKQFLDDKEIKKKIRQTNLERYGCECYLGSKECQEKTFKLMQDKNLFVKSSYEKLVENILREFYKDKIVYQYKSASYPFKCDFFAPSKNIYIEVQAHWSHGPFPYDINNVKCEEILNEWKEKSITHQSYTDAINVWTNKDVNKRKVALSNNINYIEIFNFDNAMIINSLKTYNGGYLII